jgi:hypothetical protein
MALSKQQEQTKELSEKSGLILVNFANEESAVKAIYDLHSAFRGAFNVTLFNAKKMSKSKEDSIRKDQQRLKKLFDELQADKTLKDSDTIGEYNLDYYCLCHGQFVPDARYQDGISMLQELEENGGIPSPFDAVLAILVFQYLKDENRKQIRKCLLSKCGKYFLVRNQRGKFCCDCHRVAQHRLNNTAKASKLPRETDDQQPPVTSQDSQPSAITQPVCPS